MTSSPKTLQKAEEITIMAKIESFLCKHVTILLPILVMILLFLIIALTVAVIQVSSAHTIVMLDSGNYYNHLKDVI